MQLFLLFFVFYFNALYLILWMYRSRSRHYESIFFLFSFLELTYFANIQCSPFLMLFLGSTEMDHVISELCYNGTILQRNYRKMTTKFMVKICCKFTVNPEIFANSVKRRDAKNLRLGHYFPISVNDSHFHETSHMPSLAKIKPSRKFPNLQYMVKFFGKKMYNIFRT